MDPEEIPRFVTPLLNGYNICKGFEDIGWVRGLDVVQTIWEFLFRHFSKCFISGGGKTC